ncbi:MAG: hypothetical protein ABI720_09535 [Actinomycetes bacterium]
MLTRLIGIAVLVSASTLAAPVAQAKTDALPAQSHAFGASRAEWGRAYVQWDVGDSVNPVSSGVCGEMVNGIFFLVTTIEPDAHVQCDVPVGTPILIQHAGSYAWGPADGETDAELEAAARANFGDPDSSLTVDGRPVRLTTTETGAFDVTSEPGSAYDVDFGLGTGVIRTAAVEQVTLLHPLTPGQHEVIGRVDFGAAGEFGVTYSLDVG